MQFIGLRQLALGVAVALSLAVAGCSHNAKHGHKHGHHKGGAATEGAGEGSNFAGEEGDLLAKRKFYFEYDRADIQEQDHPVIQAHADYLKENANRHVRVEGHTDENGSREYNVALGERRANAVAHALTSQGVSRSQISTVSFGKEKPESDGRGEESYRLNRRAVIVYENN
jgi:peptidoglycan-associated lipoprotein